MKRKSDPSILRRNPKDEIIKTEQGREFSTVILCLLLHTNYYAKLVGVNAK